MLKINVVVGLLLMTINFTALAQKYSNEFLAIGVGARAHGMAGAQTALTEDLTAAYWNPAGLSNIEAPFQLAAMHAEWFVGVTQYDYIGFGTSLNRERNAFLSFSLIRLGVDNIPYTINLVNPDGTINYDNISSFSAADYAFMTSYGRKLRNPAFSLGGSFKIVRRVIGNIGNSWGFGADFGFQYRKNNLQLGVMARDLTTTFNAWSFNLTEQEKQVFEATGNEIPVSNTEITRPLFVFGGAYRFILGKKSTLTPALDVALSTDGQRNVLVSSSSFNLDPALGLEFNYDRFLQLRAGVGRMQRVIDDFDPDKERLTAQPNLGVGITLGRLQIDYALTDVGNLSQLRYSHIFSAHLNFKERKQPETNF
ncbi:MAG: PorV/PorQ family protein [Saprospiraceae bacterium]|nr:PorV/PorQ family protein [Saprospiraceae bacterium]